MTFWNDLRVAIKIGVGIGSVVVILVLVSALSYTGIGGILVDAR